MFNFERGETVICSLQINREGVPFAGADSVLITIYKPDGTVAQAETPMTDNGDGLYQYDYATLVGADEGVYRAKVKATYSSRVTIKNGAFKLRG